MSLVSISHWGLHEIDAGRESPTDSGAPIGEAEISQGEIIARYEEEQRTNSEVMRIRMLAQLQHFQGVIQ